MRSIVVPEHGHPLHFASLFDNFFCRASKKTGTARAKSRLNAPNSGTVLEARCMPSVTTPPSSTHAAIPAFRNWRQKSFLSNLKEPA